MNHFQLHVKRQRRRNTVRVVLVRRQSFRLQENRMTVLTGKTLHLIFNRRAVPRTNAFNDAGIHRRPIQIRQNDVVHFFIGVRDPTRHLLRMHDIRFHQRKMRYRIQISRLFLALRKIDAPPVDTAGRPRLQAPLTQTGSNQFFRQRHRRRIAGAPGTVMFQADMHQAV